MLLLLFWLVLSLQPHCPRFLTGNKTDSPLPSLQHSPQSSNPQSLLLHFCSFWHAGSPTVVRDLNSEHLLWPLTWLPLILYRGNSFLHLFDLIFFIKTPFPLLVISLKTYITWLFLGLKCNIKYCTQQPKVSSTTSLWPLPSLWTRDLELILDTLKHQYHHF